MRRYATEYGRFRSEAGRGYDLQYGGERRFIAQSRRFQDAPFRGRGPADWRERAAGRPARYDVGLGAPAARRRQIREEQQFQQERAAPGEDLGWGGERRGGGARPRRRLPRSDRGWR